MTYLWLEGEPIFVTTDRLGAPLKFRWGARLHPVEQVVARWRIDRDWWQERVWREYFLLLTGSGMLVILYRDLTTHEWYFERLYD